MEGRSIALKELVPIVVACIVWGQEWKGQEWKGQVVVAHCDNMAVVKVVNTGYSKDKMLMHLLQALFWVRAHWEVVVRVVHIPGHKNGPADAISRDNLGMFFAQVPRAARTSTQVPQEVSRLLCEAHMDWTSPTWAQELTGFLRQDWQNQLERPTAQGPRGTGTSAREWERSHSR